MSRRFPQRGMGAPPDGFPGVFNDLSLPQAFNADNEWDITQLPDPSQMPAGSDSLETINYLLKYCIGNKMKWMNVPIAFSNPGVASEPVSATTTGQGFPMLIMGAATGVTNPTTMMRLTNNTDSWTFMVNNTPVLAVASQYNGLFNYMPFPQPILVGPQKVLELDFTNASVGTPDNVTNLTFTCRMLTQTQFSKLEQLYGQ